VVCLFCYLITLDLYRKTKIIILAAPHGGNHALLRHVFMALKWSMLAPVIPYVLYMGLQCVQPLLIQRLTEYISAPLDGTELDRDIGYGLIAAYGLLYICIAFANAWAQHLSYRFSTMLRGTLVNLIYRKTIDMSICGLDDASAVTLMSTDVERIVHGMARLHETWSTILMIGAAMYFLKRQVGIAFIAPLLIFLCEMLHDIKLPSVTC
jgi:ATP-binding cassette, subfamily C (CFTR/MRP), member 1